MNNNKVEVPPEHSVEEK